MLAAQWLRDAIGKTVSTRTIVKLGMRVLLTFKICVRSSASVTIQFNDHSSTPLWIIFPILMNNWRLIFTVPIDSSSQFCSNSIDQALQKTLMVQYVAANVNDFKFEELI